MSFVAHKKSKIPFGILRVWWEPEAKTVWRE